MSLISVIVAMGRERVIGIENRLPWHLPEDLKWFRRHTLGKPVLMGRNTYDSIGRPLPGRRMLVVSRDPAFRPEGVELFDSVEAALAAAAEAPELMVAGGASIYAQLLPRAGRLYLTEVEATLAGDAWFPEFDRSQWHESASEPHPAAGDLPAYRFTICERLSPTAP